MVFTQKASLFDALHDMPETYGISFACAGGHNSPAAALACAGKLARLSVDLAQTFTLYAFCNFDPQGWPIPEGFVEANTVPHVAGRDRTLGRGGSAQSCEQVGLWPASRFR